MHDIRIEITWKHETPDGTKYGRAVRKIEEKASLQDIRREADKVIDSVGRVMRAASEREKGVMGKKIDNLRMEMAALQMNPPIYRPGGLPQIEAEIAAADKAWHKRYERNARRRQRYAERKKDRA